MWKKTPVLCAPDEGGDGSAGGAAPPAAEPAAAPAATTGQAAAPAAPAAAPAAAAPSAAPAAGESKPAAAPPAAAEGAKPAADIKGNEGYWPADWRKTVSKDDAKVLARLERYASPEAAMQALIEAQNRISKGDLKPALGKNATPEQLAEWRAANGIPDAPDKYDLGKGVTEVFQPELLAEVLNKAHATNQTPEQVKATLEAWRGIQTKVAEQRAEKDLDLQTQGEDALRAEWGPEFRRNINLIHGMLDGSASPQLKDALLGGRLADGTPIGSSPEALKFLVGLALIQNPAGVVVPGSHADPSKGVDDEISTIEKTMRTNRAEYNRDEKMQARYRELLGAREKLKPR